MMLIVTVNHVENLVDDRLTVGMDKYSSLSWDREAPKKLVEIWEYDSSPRYPRFNIVCMNIDEVMDAVNTLLYFVDHDLPRTVDVDMNEKLDKLVRGLCSSIQLFLHPEKDTTFVITISVPTDLSVTALKNYVKSF